MNTYIKRLKEFLSAQPLYSEARGVDSAMEMLLQYYRENHPADTEKMRADFAQLDGVLSKLTLKEYDRVWDLTCDLCTEHERQAFSEGFRVGAKLILELE